MSNVPIQYIGAKPTMKDTVAGTGTIWAFHGDVQEVEAKAAPLLLHHSGIWRVPEQAAFVKKTIAESNPGGDTPPADTGDTPPDTAGDTPPSDEDPHLLAAMNDEELKSFAKSHGLNTQREPRADLRKKGEDLLESVRAALAAADIDAEKA